MDDIAAKAAMRVVEEARSPMPGGCMSDTDASGCVVQVERFPPVEREDTAEAEVADDVFNPLRHNGDGNRLPAPAHFACDGSERRAVQVIHVRVSDQNRMD